MSCMRHQRMPLESFKNRCTNIFIFTNARPHGTFITTLYLGGVLDLAMATQALRYEHIQNAGR